MFFGATSSSATHRAGLVDLNLLPTEFRPKPFPVLSIGLVVLALGCAVLLYAAYYAKTYADLEIAQLNSRVNQAEVVVRAATGDPAAAARQDQLRAMRDDFKVLTQRQINWGDVFQTIGDAPPGVVVNTISQAGFGITLTGSGTDSAAAAAYLNKLRASKLFVDAALQLSPASVTATATPSETSVPPTSQPPTAQPPPAVAPPATPVPPAPAAARVNTPVPARSNPPAQAQAAAAANPILTRTPIPTITPTPPNTETATPTVTPTSAFDFVLLTTQQIPTSNPMVGSSDIKGTVVDLNRKPMGGLTIEIDSEGSPPWSSTRVTDAANGSFDFAVNHGKFKVFVAAGRSQPAVDLYTGANGVAGTYGYQLSFQATFSGTPSAAVIGTPTDTPTQTASPSPSATPISLGRNIASWGCANAYLQNSPAVHLGNNANLAIDGNLGTEWNASVAPTNGSHVIWQWSLPSSPTKCNDGRTAAGLPDSQVQIEGFQLIPDQNPAGNTIHELWLYADTGCTSNLHTDNTAYFTWNGQTSAGQILPLRISPAVLVRCIIVRTLADPSFVAWEEIQIYQTVPPPQGFSTLTVTPTITMTGTPTVTGTPPTSTPTATSTVTGTPPTSAPTGTPTVTGTPPTSTPSVTPTVTPTQSPTSSPTFPPFPGGFNQDLVPYVTSVTMTQPTSLTLYTCVRNSFPTSPPCAAIDGVDSTFWPTTPGGDPQGLTLLMTSPEFPLCCYQISDVQVRVFSSNNSSAYRYQITYLDGSATPIALNTCTLSAPTGFVDGAIIDCAPARSTPVAGVKFISVFLAGPNGEDGSHGIRDIRAYSSSNVIPTPPTNTPIPHKMATLTTSRTTPGIQGNSMASATPTRTASTIRSTSALGRGQGPGQTAVFGPNDQPQYALKAAAVPSPTPGGPTPIPPPPAPSSGPVDFTIVLEVASGTGY